MTALVGNFLSIIESKLKIVWPGTSLVVLWLRRHLLSAGGSGSIPGQGIRTLQLRVHMPQLKIPQASK